MTADQLRKSILQQAIQGKLVPQDPNDEPASALLERIREEKARLVKEKKIKKEKNPSVIFRGEDNSHYEKFILTGEVKCIDDEIPFELPNGWEWCVIGDLFLHNNGKQLNKDNTVGTLMKYITTSNLYWDGFRLDNLKTMPFENKEIERCQALKGDLLVCEGGDIGRSCIWEYDESIMLQNHIHKLRAYLPICTKYFYYIFYLYNLSGIIGGKGIGIQGFSSKALHNTRVPLPPLAEQQRIVAKIEELMPLVEQYGKAQSELNKLNTNIREQLKKSILQYAIEGKLVPQCEEDGTAEDSLQEIQAEKQRLYAEGKLKKKDLTHSTIFRGEDNKYYEQIGKEVICIDEEIPFKIPVSWRWVRVKDVVKINPKNEYSDNTIAAFIPMEKIEATFLSKFSYTKVQWGGIKSSFTHFADGDVAFAKITPCFQNRKSIVLQNLPNGIGAGTTELKVLRPYRETIQSSFLMYFLETPYFVENASYKGTANQQRILVGYLENKLLALPPLNEQRKISNAITALLHLLD